MSKIKEYYEKHQNRNKDGREVRSYEMFSKAGDRKAHSIAGAAIRKIAGAKRVTKEDIITLVSDKLNETYKAGKHKEIWDSEPPYHIAYYINQALEIAGYGFEIDRYEFDCTV